MIADNIRGMVGKKEEEVGGLPLSYYGNNKSASTGNVVVAPDNKIKHSVWKGVYDVEGNLKSRIIRLEGRPPSNFLTYFVKGTSRNEVGNDAFGRTPVFELTQYWGSQDDDLISYEMLFVGIKDNTHFKLKMEWYVVSTGEVVGEWVVEF